jgi:hypothetical protein
MLKAIPPGFLAICGLFMLCLGLTTGCNKPTANVVKDVFDHVDAMALENNKALLIYFHHKYDDVSIAQTPIVDSLAKELSGSHVKVLKVDSLRTTEYTESQAFAQHFNVHNHPTFILKKAGETYYFRRIGLLSTDDLKQWIANCMKRPATFADQSEQQ